MMNLAHDLIVNINGWLAVMVLGIAAGCAAVTMNIRWSRSLQETARMTHQETMTRIETTHREKMLQIGRDTPKLADGRPANVIENGQQPTDEGD
jgi:hypothetical protein